jgi:hypothetical protein
MGNGIYASQTSEPKLISKTHDFKHHDVREPSGTAVEPVFCFHGARFSRRRPTNTLNADHCVEGTAGRKAAKGIIFRLMQTFRTSG